MPTADSAQPYDQMRVAVWDRALFATGTAHIFEVRARKMRKRLNRLTFSGLVLPIAVGAVVIAYGADMTGLTTIITIAAGLGSLQLIVVLWSVVEGWADRSERAVRSLLANQALAQDLESLAKNPPSALSALRHQFEVLAAKDDAQHQQDHAQDISEKEKRMGMRNALLRFDRACVKCDRVPTSMKPTECGVCGDF